MSAFFWNYLNYRKRFLQSMNNFNHLAEIGLACSNIILTGGSAKLPQFRERLHQDIRSSIPDIFPINIFVPEKPEEYAWLGARRFAIDQQRKFGKADFYSNCMVSKKEYMENGCDFCNEKFGKMQVL